MLHSLQELEEPAQRWKEDQLPPPETVLKCTLPQDSGSDQNLAQGCLSSVFLDTYLWYLYLIPSSHNLKHGLSMAPRH